MRKISQRKSLMARHRASNRPNKTIRFNSSKPQYPPSYRSWLALKEKQNKQLEKLVKFKRRKVELDKNLDAELRLSELNVLFELARDKNYKIPKNVLQNIAYSLYQLNAGSKFTHWSFKPPRSNRRESDPQLEFLKGLAVAFIHQADSVVEEERRRLFVAEHFGIGKNHYKDWESLAEKGALPLPDFSGLAAKGQPHLIADSNIEWAGKQYLGFKRKRSLET